MVYGLVRRMYGLRQSEVFLWRPVSQAVRRVPSTILLLHFFTISLECHCFVNNS